MKGTQAALMLMNRQPGSGNNILNTTYIYLHMCLSSLNPHFYVCSPQRMLGP